MVLFEIVSLAVSPFLLVLHSINPIPCIRIVFTEHTLVLTIACNVYVVLIIGLYSTELTSRE